MFPIKIFKNDKEYFQSDLPVSISKLKNFLLKNPNEIYVVANEKIEEETEPLFTEFLVIYIKEFKDNVTLYDISRDRQ